ncbi:hypothetical protein ASD04_02985 [Devosia sp. Root436]|jgi:uncharacterized membrane protein (UPF0127 family)|uniref:DUF192 domain-containing protein n=1 Tax=Devosia sp. Root436 TaxID=1736537 RepID=UPI0006F4BD90|nr:DUF192 domain-containing protein [Devosia sp. Root436]KQX42934.1 hypothetical protein ASD04_02985 [Devosia sp. Root436]
MMMFAQRLAPVLRRAAVVIAIGAVALPLAACSDEGKLVLHSSTGDYSFNVEVVDTPESRAQGLMYRTELADDAGMLFDFKEERPVSFWMRNTFIPLDMVFVGADGVVKTIHVNARPHDITSIPSEVPVQFVLEIPGGRSEEIGLKPGDTMEHDRVTKPAN